MTSKLRIKNGKYYAVIVQNCDNGKKKEKWFPTGLVAKGNKKKANEVLEQCKKNYESAEDSIKIPKQRNINKERLQRNYPITNNCTSAVVKYNAKLLFGEYLFEWLDKRKSELEETTYFSYKSTIKTISDYFNVKNIYLNELTEQDIKNFYEERKKTVSLNTIAHYHANISKALKDACIDEIIQMNPASKIAKPKFNLYIAKYYNIDEIMKLFEIVKSTRLELVILIATYYGLRRGEILGLKRDAFDFSYKTITIKHTVQKISTGGSSKLIQKDKVKTTKSFRTLPLVPQVEKALIKKLHSIDKNRKFMGNHYNEEYLEYINVDEVGNLLLPDKVTNDFKYLTKKNNMKVIRFHDLRHSCATLLRREGVSLEDIQHWLGHSSVKTTEMIYAHFDNMIHLNSAKKIVNALSKNADKSIYNTTSDF